MSAPFFQCNVSPCTEKGADTLNQLCSIALDLAGASENFHKCFSEGKGCLSNFPTGNVKYSYERIESMYIRNRSKCAQTMFPGMN